MGDPNGGRPAVRGCSQEPDRRRAAQGSHVPAQGQHQQALPLTPPPRLLVPLASAEMPMDSATALITSLLTSVSSAKRDRAPLDSSSEKLRGQGQRGRA